MTNNYKNFTKVLSDIIWASPFLGGREILDDALVNKKVVQDVKRSGPKVVILKFNFREVYDMECCRFLSAYEFYLWYIYKEGWFAIDSGIVVYQSLGLWEE